MAGKAWLLASAEQGQDDVSTLDLLLALWQDEALRGALQSGSAALARQDGGRLQGAYAALRQHGGEASANAPAVEAGVEPTMAAPVAGKRSRRWTNTP